MKADTSIWLWLDERTILTPPKAGTEHPVGVSTARTGLLGTHRDQIEAAVAQYGSVPRRDMPRRMRCPCSEHEFDLALAIELSRREGWGDWLYPLYNDHGFLTYWHGVRLAQRTELRLVGCSLGVSWSMM